MKIKLTALLLTTLSEDEYFDTYTPDLIFRVGKKRRTWYCRYRQGGKRPRKKLGYFLPNNKGMGLAEARKAAGELAKRIDAGLPVVAEPEPHPRSPNVLTVGMLIDRYERMRLKEGGRTKSLSRSLATLRHSLKPHLSTPAREFTRKDLRALRDRVAKTAPAMARRMLSYLAPVLAWGVEEDLLETNIARDLRKSPEVKRTRKLTDAEIHKVWDACGRFDSGPVARSFARMVKFLLVSAQRRSEAAGLRYEHVIDDIWHQEENKSGRPQRLPLPSLALSLVGKGKAQDLVFPGVAGEISGFSKLKRELDKLAGIDAWTLHDLRRTASSGLGDLGIDDLTVRSILNHGITGALSHYMVAELQAQKKRALAAWADELERIVSSPCI